MFNALIVDDDPFFLDYTANVLADCGYKSIKSKRLDEGIREARTGGFDIIFLDVNLPDGNGLHRIAEFKVGEPSAEVVIITGDGTMDGAEAALKNGAWDYIQKPATANSIRLLIKRAQQFRNARIMAVNQRKNLKRDSIIGDSPALRACLSKLNQAAKSSGSLLITGETGTGKELFAKAAHDNSSRSSNNFIVVDCTCIPKTLAESLLFGHKKGSYTDAKEDREGLFALADGGTLFLDEIGDLPLEVQKTLLRVLQERRFRCIGSQRERSSDFRLIAATNRDLATMVEEKRFRKDLYFRLQTLMIELPPLRERQNDIEQIAAFYIPRICEDHNIGPKTMSNDFLEALHCYDWPGNIREFINTLYTAVSNAFEEKQLHPYHLPLDIRVNLVQSKLGASEQDLEKTVSDEFIASELESFETFPTYKQMRETTIERTEHVYFKLLLKKCNNDLVKACSYSGLSRARIYEILKKHQIDRKSI
ncbi:sigma-54-dependent transcriptional regulator [Desulfovibrio inopinatus]|uniref:sigma-54-dependent transcriptional regulator n=1 Tax=Desulfovibrio inopinatus TaxID=102109 RepID=UPI0004274D0D|nr:sigma-54 dependent transcriptional regulator [Desulfovibrio inopinatus]